LYDATGRRRSPATTPGFRAGIAPRNKGQRYPVDPPTVEEIVAVMRRGIDVEEAVAILGPFCNVAFGALSPDSRFRARRARATGIARDVSPSRIAAAW
jgi:hypothetical protein